MAVAEATVRRPPIRAARRSYRGYSAPASTAAMKSAAANGRMTREIRYIASTVRTRVVQKLVRVLLLAGCSSAVFFFIWTSREWCAIIDAT